jgi:hypothetical protein
MAQWTYSANVVAFYGQRNRKPWLGQIQGALHGTARYLAFNTFLDHAAA